MVFSSITFLFYFLPLFLLVFYVFRQSKNVVILFSVIFYAWGEPTHITLLFASILMNYALGLLIEQAHRHGGARLWISIGIIANLTPLLFFKYGFFVAQTALATIGRPPSDLSFMPTNLPLGISFYTFHALSYLIDVYRKDVSAERSIGDMVLYIAMFPQLVAGPLVRYKKISDQLHQPEHSLQRTACGIRLFIVGLAQKVLIANTLGANADVIFGLPAHLLSQSLAWLGIGCYTLQIYFDFGGYSLMAIGLALIIGFNFPQNFNYPYVARSITEFWRRWHISLSSWFRDYVYIPLGGNQVGPVRTYVNLVVVFLLCGFWHGAAWNFLVWGLAHGIFLVIERLGLGHALRAAPLWLQHGYVMFIVMTTWTLFRADTLPHAGYYLAAMAGLGPETPLAAPMQRYLGADVLITVAAAVALAGPAGHRFATKTQQCIASRSRSLAIGAELVGLTALLFLVFLSLAGGAYNPFIYFRF